MQILPTFAIRNIWRTVRRNCILILGFNGLIWAGKGKGSQSSSGTPSTQNFTKYPSPPTSGTMPSLQRACYVAACPTEQFTTMNLELFVQEGSLYHLYVVRIMTSKLKKKCSKVSYVSDCLFIGMSVCV